MGRLLLLGAALLAFHGHHQRQYWWPVMDDCTIGAVAKGGTIYVGIKPGIYCVQRPGHWASTPPPVEQPAG